MRVGNFRKLSEDEIQERLARYARRPDSKIRDEIVLQYANLVESIARRFLGACEPLEDLVQEGYIGLIRSVDKYDVNMGVKFSTYATHFIIGEIKHYLRDKGKIIKEPAWLQELNQRMTRVIESLNQKFGRQPTEREIAEVMHMPESTVREILTTREVFKVTSLDGDKDDTTGTRDTEKIKDQKVFAFQLPVEDKIVLETALERLKDIERQVIAAHYYKGLNQTEIARQLGISCNYVSHILRNGTKKLRKILTTEEIRDSQMQRILLSKRSGQCEEADETASVIDSTTGVYSREYFMERLDEELSRAYRENYKVSLLLIEVCLPDELDRYIRMIRTDDVLYAVAQNIRASVRRMDLVARFDDMSFAVLLPHTAGHASTVADRLTAKISSMEIDSGLKNRPITVDVRIGIARYPADANSRSEMIEAAMSELGIHVEHSTDDSQTQLDKAA